MNALDYIAQKYNLSLNDKSLIEIANVGRNDLATFLKELDFTSGVEIGVEEGLYSKVLCKANPQMKIFGVDPWKSYNTCEVGPSEAVGGGFIVQERCDKFYAAAVKRLAPFPNYKIIKKASLEAAAEFADNSLDFVYIDANHEYSFVLADITAWSKKVKPGGIVSGHDYYVMRNPKVLMGVKKAVDYFVAASGIKPLVIWGARERTPGAVRDKWRSWSWIKS